MATTRDDLRVNLIEKRHESTKSCSWSWMDKYMLYCLMTTATPSKVQRNKKITLIFAISFWILDIICMIWSILLNQDDVNAEINETVVFANLLFMRFIELLYHACRLYYYWKHFDFFWYRKTHIHTFEYAWKATLSLIATRREIGLMKLYFSVNFLRSERRVKSLSYIQLKSSSAFGI